MSVPCSLCNMNHPGNENPEYCKEAIQALLDLNDERKAEVERLKVGLDDMEASMNADMDALREEIDENAGRQT